LIGVVLLTSLIAGDSNDLLVGTTDCPVGEDCAPAVVASLECASGGACNSPSDAPPIVGDAAPPAVTGQTAAVIEEPCGALLYDHNAHQHRAPASLTKIATALVAVETADPSETVTVQVSGAELSASTDSTVMGLEPGQLISVRDLLYGLLLPSGNDAAIAIAQHVAGSAVAFASLMNGKATEMGLNDTQFTNPHGLDDPGLYTSAFDIATLGRELLRQPLLAAIVRTGTYQPPWDGPALWNSNRLLQLYPESLGVKIGYTDGAAQTIVAAAERDGRRLIVSVMGSTDVYQDAIALFEWAFADAPSACAD
jgi:D-alanyl-D-alanine carboxypeptidase